MIPVITAALVGLGSFFAIGKFGSPTLRSMDVVEVDAADITLEGSSDAETAAGRAILNAGGRIRCTCGGNSATILGPNGALVEDKSAIDAFVTNAGQPVCNVRFKRSAIKAIISRAA